jgi:hypothetical protein
VCPDGIRLRLGLQWRDPGPAAETLAARYLRISAASQPPPRAGGAAWEDGIRVRDADGGSHPFQAADDRWKRDGVVLVEGTPSLGQPAPDTIVLDRWLAVPFVPDGDVDATAFSFTADPDPRAFLSVPYPQPPAGKVPVWYAGAYDLRWSRPLEPGAFVAVSLDRFWPPERDSADYLAQVEDCQLHAPGRPGPVAGTR